VTHLVPEDPPAHKGAAAGHSQVAALGGGNAMDLLTCIQPGHVLLPEDYHHAWIPDRRIAVYAQETRPREFYVQTR
jgi:hypothetical protein